jgi:pimeloyl-ACP methyl ester carboxylesterase
MRPAAPETPRRRRFGRRFWVRMILAACLLYLVLAALAFALQTLLIFPGAGRDPVLPAAAESVAVAAPDGVTLRGIVLPAEAPAGGAPVILSFSGNGTNAAGAALYVHRLFPEAEVIAFHYRGYKPSGGRAGAGAICADALLVRDFAARRFPGRPIVAIGFSIGSGVASWLASRHPLAGLILVTPFDSLEKVAADRTPWLPVALLFRNPMESAQWLRRSRLPVAVISGGADRLVRPGRTAALREAIPNLVYARVIAGAGHNDIYDRPEFRVAMAEALARILAPPARP